MRERYGSGGVLCELEVVGICGAGVSCVCWIEEEERAGVGECESSRGLRVLFHEVWVVELESFMIFPCLLPVCTPFTGPLFLPPQRAETSERHHHSLSWFRI